MRLQLRADVSQVAPFLRRDRDPFDAAAGGEQHPGNGDESDADGDGPPVLAVVRAAQWTHCGQRPGGGDFGHAVPPLFCLFAREV